MIYVASRDVQVTKDRQRLSLEAFPKDRLRKRESSVSRRQYTDPSSLRINVIDKIVAKGGALIGVAVANVKDIRDIPCRHPLTEERCQAFCVLDYVEADEADDHGVITFAESMNDVLRNLKDRLVYAVREPLRAALLETFSRIQDVDECFAVRDLPLAPEKLPGA